MPTFPFKLDDGRSGTFEASDAESAEAVFEQTVLPDMMRRSQDRMSYPGRGGTGATPEIAPAAPKPPPPKKAPMTEEERARFMESERQLYDPAKGMPWYEKGAVGLHGGVRSALTGAADLFNMASPEAVEERKEWDLRKGNLGGWGTAGELIGEAGITAPIGGPLGAAGKVLTKAVPGLARLAGKGGKLLNVGNVTSGAAQGAATGAIVGSSDDKTLRDRADDVAVGLGMGGAGPLVFAVAKLPFKLIGSAVGGMKHMLSTDATILEKKTYEALKKVLGEERITNIYRAMTDGGPPRQFR